MAFNAKALKDFSIDFEKGQILPPELVSYLVRTGRIMSMVAAGELEIGRNA